MPLAVLALNPSIDAEWIVARVRPEEKNEVCSERRWPGGKGVNVARWLRRFGRRARLWVPLGGLTGRELARQLRREGLPARVFPVSQPTRVNVIVTPDEGPQLRFNPLWHRWPRGEWLRVAAALRARLPRLRWLVLSGSLPRGIPRRAYATLIRDAARAGVASVLDCDGPALAAAVPARPWLVKPNETELAEWSGEALSSDAAVVRAARALAASTEGWVLVSRGERGGLLVHAAEGVSLSARAPRVRVRNTVGAGDALLAAVVDRVVAGAPPAQWLAWGLAAGSAAAACAPGQLPGLPTIQRLAAGIRIRSGSGTP